MIISRLGGVVALGWAGVGGIGDGVGARQGGAWVSREGVGHEW